MILTIESLALELCRSVLDEDDEAIGKAAFLQAVIEGDWSSMPDYEPVFHEDQFVGVRKRGEE